MNKTSLFTRLLAGSLTASSLIASGVPARAANSPLVDLVLEKRVIGDLSRANLPTIDPENYQTQPFNLSSPSSSAPLVVQPLWDTKGVVKRYDVAPEPEHYQSLIRIYDASTGAKRGQLSVGRRIQSMVASPKTNSLFVLCGGYFGSVWEIDTVHDVVRRKLSDFSPEAHVSPLWNPKNMALSADGSTLAVGSDRLQLIDVRSGRLLQSLDLPAGAVEVSSLQSLSGGVIGVGLRMAQGGYQRYQVLGQPGNYTLAPGGGAAGARNLSAQVKTYSAPAPGTAQVFFVASRNSDYVRMVDRRSLATVGVLPVDFNVDDMVLSPDRKRLFVYNSRFGQISVIEMNARSPETFSVIKRFRDKRFEGEGKLQLGAAAGQVFLWDGENNILAGFDAFNLYQRMNISFGVKLNPRLSSPVWVSQPAHQRFYSRDGKLYAEYMDADPSELPMEIALGSPVLQLQLSADRRQVYALTQNHDLVVLNALSPEHEVLQRRNLQSETEGMTPRYLAMSLDNRHLFVVDADQGLVRVFQANDLKYVRAVAWNMGLNQPQQINLYDPRQSQLIQVELPRHLNDVVRVTQ